MQPQRQDIPSVLKWNLTPIDTHQTRDFEQLSQQLSSHPHSQLDSQTHFKQHLQLRQQLNQKLQQLPQQTPQLPQLPQQYHLQSQQLLPQPYQPQHHQPQSPSQESQQLRSLEKLRFLTRNGPYSSFGDTARHFQRGSSLDKPELLHIGPDDDASDHSGENDTSQDFNSQPPSSPGSPDPKMKRKAQNRAAQRAFRERRQVYVKQLEEKNREQYRNHIEITRRLQAEIFQLRAAQDHLKVENNLLKSQAAAFMFDRSSFKANAAQRLHDTSAWMPTVPGQNLDFDLLSGSQPSTAPLPVTAGFEGPSSPRGSIDVMPGDAQKVPSLLEPGLANMGFFGQLLPSPLPSPSPSLSSPTMAGETMYPNFVVTPEREERPGQSMEARLRAWKKVMDNERFDEMDGEQLRNELKIIGDNLVPHRLRN